MLTIQKETAISPNKPFIKSNIARLLVLVATLADVVVTFGVVRGKTVVALETCGNLVTLRGTGLR